MGCTQSHRNHPEAKVYDLLECLNHSFGDYSLCDDQIKTKIEKSLLKIEAIIPNLPIISPFVKVEIQITLETLQKQRPRVYRIQPVRERFLNLISLSDLSCNRTPRKSRGNSADITAPSTPSNTLRKQYGEANIDQNMRNSSGSGTTHLGSSSRASADRAEDEIFAPKLKSFYRNTENQSVETMGEYGFYDEHDLRFD